MTKILFADDDSSMHAIVRRICLDQGLDLVSAYDGRDALAASRRDSFDLVILDVMMPLMDGFSVCKHLREDGVKTPVLFLSAKGDIVDKGVGFDAGGDDYIVKPFSTEELGMRIRAHIRRQERNSFSALDRIEYGGLSINVLNRKVFKDGVPIDLTPKELDVLLILASNKGEIFTREQLTVEIWGEDYSGEILGIAVYVRRIREKIEDDPSKPRYIQTVWREGYRFGD